MFFAMVAPTDLKLGLILFRVLVLGLQAWATRPHFCNADLTNVKLVNKQPKKQCCVFAQGALDYGPKARLPPVCSISGSLSDLHGLFPLKGEK